MGNIALHVGANAPVQAPADMWLTALLMSLPADQRSVVIQNLAKIKEQRIPILNPVPVKSGTIRLPG